MLTVIHTTCGQVAKTVPQHSRIAIYAKAAQTNEEEAKALNLICQHCGDRLKAFEFSLKAG